VLVPWLIVGLATCAGCGSSAGNNKSSAASSCSDSTFTTAVSARLAALDNAVLVVDAGHWNVAALAKGAPRLTATSSLLHEASQNNVPCRSELVKARGLVLVATRDLSRAGRQLRSLTDALRKGKASGSLESDFLGSYSGGTQEFQDALASLREAGGPRLVSASDGRGIFNQAGCANCHTLAAAGARSKVGPNLDRSRPSKSMIVRAVTYGQGTMVSFGGTLSAAQIQAVADFVSRNAGK
jgi:cytochrome c6